MKLGKAFSDNVETGYHQQSLRTVKETSWWLGVGRGLFFITLLIVLSFSLLFRLFDLTIVRGHEYRSLADGNRTKELIRHAPRGRLLDRTGTPLTKNFAQYRLIAPCADSPTTCITRIDHAAGEAMLAKGMPENTFLETDFERIYEEPESIAHVVGYTGELTADELEETYYTERNYQAGDRLGRSGAEALYESTLRGRDGKELVEVDAQGKILRTLGRDPEIAGEDVILAIDADLARAAKEAFPPNMKGAVIVSKPKTGEILALYSSPSYSPTAFAKGLSAEAYSALIDNPDRPLVNRAIGGVYPPGSTFKLITAIAALEEGAITKNTLIEDTGVVQIGEFSFGNWYFSKYGKTEGNVDLVRGLARSNDIYFYKIGELLGITKLADWARKFGIGRPLGIELAGETSGLVPDPAWKESHFTHPLDLEARNNLWYLGDTYHVAIGQGYLLTTPLQVNIWTNVVANQGKLCRPTIEKIRGEDTNNATCRSLDIAQEHIDIVMKGMVNACSAGGTGWPLFNFSVQRGEVANVQPTATNNQEAKSRNFIPIACKTGTAEFGDPDDKTHAWITAFAPVPESVLDSGNQSIKQDQNVVVGTPEISVTVLVEEAGEGSDKAGPIAKKIFEEWFSR